MGIVAALSLSLQAESLNSIKSEMGMSKGIAESRSQEVVLFGKKTMVKTNGNTDRVDPKKSINSNAMIMIQNGHGNKGAICV